jgi:hypothetical protein
MEVRMAHCRAFVSIFVLLLEAPPFSASASQAPRIVGDAAIAEWALAAVDAYHRLDIELLRARLGEGFEFVERLRKELDGPGFLAMLPTLGTDYSGREIDVDWVGVIPAGEGVADGGTTVDVRGRWRATEVASGRVLDFAFSMRLGLALEPHLVDGEIDGKITSWTQVFAGWLPMPVHGDGKHSSEHFEIRYLPAEFSAEDAARLAALAETWYRRTAEYLGRGFESGRRMLFDVASLHAIPYASAPGPDAFFLVSAEYAKKDYGFSLVHELTHNLVGLSRLSESTHDDYEGGNRMFDEGFGVYVEEKLVEDGRVFPNFGQEIHRAYLDLHRRLGVPRPPVLEAEGLRSRGSGDERRLGYLQQASFVKWLVDTAPEPHAEDGLARFLKLFEGGVDAAPELYGRDLGELEGEWLAFLDRLPASADEPF